MNRVSRALSIIRSFFGPLEQTRRVHLLGPRGERKGRAAPAQGFDVLEEGRIGAQGREILEEQRELALFAENVGREIFDLTVTIQKPGSGLRADPRNAGVTVGRIAYEREQVRYERRIDAKLFAYPSGIANRFAPAVDLHDARVVHALRQILVGRPDGDFLYLFVFRREMRGRSERIIASGRDSHRLEPLQRRLKCRFLESPPAPTNVPASGGLPSRHPSRFRTCQLAGLDPQLESRSDYSPMSLTNRNCEKEDHLVT